MSVPALTLVDENTPVPAPALSAEIPAPVAAPAARRRGRLGRLLRRFLWPSRRGFHSHREAAAFHLEWQRRKLDRRW